MAIRRLGAKDGAFYRDIRLEALKSYPKAYGTSYAEALTRPPEAFVSALVNAAILGAFADQKLVGIACFMAENGLHDRHKGHLYQMYVRPEHQGRGLGLKLVESVLNYATNKVEQIHLGVGAQNLAALALYKKAGFEIYGTEPRALLIDQTYIDEHLMIKYLDEKEI